MTEALDDLLRERLPGWVGGLAPGWPLPAVAVAAVRGDEASAFTFGRRRVDRPDVPVDAATLFPIGSCTKAMTAALLGVLVDEGRLAWTDPVADRLPGFRMADPFASAQITVAELLTHASGLATGAGDLLLYPETTATAADIVRALAHLPAARPFRTGYGYSNLLYVAAGEVAAAACGESWDTLLRRRVFAPLGMTDAAPTHADLDPERCAWPHARARSEDGGARAAPLLRNPDTFNVGPAGAVYATAQALLPWLRELLAGAQGAGRLHTPATAVELRRPRTLAPADPAPPLGFLRPDLQAYALGLQVQAVDGDLLHAHGGAVFGAVSQMLVSPRTGAAVMVMTNLDGRTAVLALAHRLLDALRGRSDDRWTEPWRRLAAASPVPSPSISPSLARAPDAVAAPVAVDGPEGLAGVYGDAWYGSAEVRWDGEALRLSLLRSPGLEGPLTPLGDDRFLTAWASDLAEPAVVRFERQGARAKGFRMTPASSHADFSFDYADLDFVRMEGDAATG